GYSYYYINDTANGILSFDTAINISSGKIDGYYGKALILYTQRKYQEAHKVIELFYANTDNTNIFVDKRKIKKLQKLIQDEL
ncbi:MAG: hypothetical protein U9Q83_09260, partial [Bacteroidota bacterium]|nr:hypothetical protein [Bacteroidota bacterium]